MMSVKLIQFPPKPDDIYDRWRARMGYHWRKPDPRDGFRICYGRGCQGQGFAWRGNDELCGWCWEYENGLPTYDWARHRWTQKKEESMTEREQAAAEVDAKLDKWNTSTVDGRCSTCGGVLERRSDPETIERYRTTYLDEGVPAPDTVSVVFHSDDCAIEAGFIEALALMQIWGFKGQLKLRQLPDGSYYSEGFERARTPD